MYEEVIQAAFEYVAGDQKECHADFLRRKGFTAKSHQIYFSMFMSASRPDWQLRAKYCREMRTENIGRTPHQRKVMRLALRIFDKRQEEANRRRTRQQAPPQRNAASDNNDDTEKVSDIKSLQASVVSMADTLRAVETQVEEASKLLVAERQTTGQWKEEKQELKEGLLKQSKALAEARRTAKRLKHDNQTRRKDMEEEVPSSFQSISNDQDIRSLEFQNQKLEQALQEAQHQFLESSQLASGSLRRERQIQDRIEHECFQLQSQLHSLQQVHQRTNASLSFQSYLVVNEQTRCSMIQAKLHGCEQQQHKGQDRCHGCANDATVSVASADDGTDQF